MNIETAKIKHYYPEGEEEYYLYFIESIEVTREEYIYYVDKIKHE